MPRTRRNDSRPRVSNGVRRGLAHIVRVAAAELCRPINGKFRGVRAEELEEIGRALEWIEWHRSHSSRRRELELAPRPPRVYQRRPKPTAAQEPMPL